MVNPRYIELSEDDEDDEDGCSYRISFTIRNLGGVLPVEAWVNSFSSKGQEPDPILREAVIGGFGYGLKDAVLCLFTHHFDGFEVFCNEPLGDDRCKFYRGLIQRTSWRDHDAPTLAIKMAMHGSAVSDSQSASIPSAVKTFFKSKAMRALPSTTVVISAVVASQAQIRGKLRALMEAVQCHSIFGPSAYFDIDNPAFDFKLPAVSSTSSSSSSSSSSGPSSTPLVATLVPDALPTPPPIQHTVEVHAPCVEEEDLDEQGPDATFYAALTACSAPCDDLRLFTWPGLELCQIDEGEKSTLGRLTKQGLYFTSFTIRFPPSFRRHTQRDRVTYYTMGLGALLGSTIIAACAQEKAGCDHFPDLSICGSTAEVLQALKEAQLPLNVALFQLLQDALDPAVGLVGGRKRYNINVDSLACYGNDARAYIASTYLTAFEPVQACKAEDVKAAQVAHAERARQAGTFSAYYDLNPIGVPVTVPLKVLPLFRNDEEGLAASSIASKIRTLVLELASFTGEWQSAPEYQVELARMKALELDKHTQVLVVELDVDPVLLCFLNGSPSDTDDKVVLRLTLTQAESKAFVTRQKLKAGESIDDDSDMEVKEEAEAAADHDGRGVTIDLVIFSVQSTLPVEDKVLEALELSSLYNRENTRTKLKAAALAVPEAVDPEVVGEEEAQSAALTTPVEDMDLENDADDSVSAADGQGKLDDCNSALTGDDLDSDCVDGGPAAHDADDGDDSVHSMADPAVEAIDLAPAEPEIVTPVEPTFTTPFDPAFTTPVDPAFTTPVDPAFTTPVDPAFTTPVDPAFTTPVDPAFTTPVDPAYTPPVDPAFATPVDPAYSPPVDPAFATPVGPGAMEQDDSVERVSPAADGNQDLCNSALTGDDIDDDDDAVYDDENDDSAQSMPSPAVIDITLSSDLSLEDTDEQNTTASEPSMAIGSANAGIPVAANVPAGPVNAPVAAAQVLHLLATRVPPGRMYHTAEEASDDLAAVMQGAVETLFN